MISYQLQWNKLLVLSAHHSLSKPVLIMSYPGDNKILVVELSRVTCKNCVLKIKKNFHVKATLYQPNRNHNSNKINNNTV